MLQVKEKQDALVILKMGKFFPFFDTQPHSLGSAPYFFSFRSEHFRSNFLSFRLVTLGSYHPKRERNMRWPVPVNTMIKGKIKKRVWILHGFAFFSFPWRS
jgi:hypothetical protein